MPRSFTSGGRRFSGIIDGFRHNVRIPEKVNVSRSGLKDRCRGAVSGTRGLCRGRGSSASERGRHRRCRCSGRQRGKTLRAYGHRKRARSGPRGPMPAVAWACLSKTTRRIPPEDKAPLHRIPLPLSYAYGHTYMIFGRLDEDGEIIERGRRRVGAGCPCGHTLRSRTCVPRRFRKRRPASMN